MSPLAMSAALGKESSRVPRSLCSSTKDRTSPKARPEAQTRSEEHRFGTEPIISELPAATTPHLLAPAAPIAYGRISCPPIRSQMTWRLPGCCDAPQVKVALPLGAQVIS